MVRKQAMVLALADVFLALTVLFVLSAALAMLMRKPQPLPAGTGGH